MGAAWSWGCFAGGTGVVGGGRARDTLTTCTQHFSRNLRHTCFTCFPQAYPLAQSWTLPWPKDQVHLFGTAVDFTLMLAKIARGGQVCVRFGCRGEAMWQTAGGLLVVSTCVHACERVHMQPAIPQAPLSPLIITSQCPHTPPPGHAEPGGLGGGQAHHQPAPRGGAGAFEAFGGSQRRACFVATEPLRPGALAAVGLASYMRARTTARCTCWDLPSFHPRSSAWAPTPSASGGKPRPC